MKGERLGYNISRKHAQPCLNWNLDTHNLITISYRPISLARRSRAHEDANLSNSGIESSSPAREIIYVYHAVCVCKSFEISQSPVK
jgi:hypothetical protein